MVVAAAVSLLLIVTACRQETRTEAPTAAALVVDSVLSEDSVLIRYDVRGSGDRALVFVHCWSCDRAHWAGQAAHFSPMYKVVTLDLAGHGASGANRAEWTMAAYGADVAAVVAKLDLPEVILVGHSMGGAVMIEAARRLGERVVALVGVDNLQNLEHQYTDEEIAGFIQQFEADFPATTYEFVRSMFPATADSILADRVSTQLASAPEAIALGSFEHLFGYDYEGAFRTVRVPLRCINSDSYPTNVEANSRVASSFAVKIMPGTGHFPHLIDPAGFNQLLHETVAEFWPEKTAP
ncbi:MAG TPA: alpha/beta hydrolase [Acidobacteriota bacterium]|nr:alpha/beta hydrolase [Acidobacteriota bacterium]